MFRYLPINTWAAPLLAGLVAGALVMQMLTPMVVYGMGEGETTTNEESTEPPPEPVAIATTAPDEDPPEEPATGGSDPVEADSETSVTTGDAVAGLDVENEVNTTEVETTTADTTPSDGDSSEETDATPPDDTTPVDQQKESTDSPSGSQTEAEAGPDKDDPTATTDETAETQQGEDISDSTLPTLPENNLTVTATNTATTTTNATATAETGDNSASGSTATIETGDAVAYADVLNVVNTNIVNSDGLVDFINDTLGYQDFDLRNDFDYVYADFDTSASTPACTLDTCADGSTTVNTDNTATINNNVTVTADTGGNQAAGDQATINTGDAYASANLINVANTNITDSNYLLLVFNNFDDYAGDIVLPNSSFFDGILHNQGGTTNVDIDTENAATITNNATVVADTGDNQAAGDTATIKTGAATATGDVTNQVNQNIVGGTAFSMLIRVQGDWSGTINGLPDGLTWRETSRGIEIVSTDQAGGSVARDLSQSTKNTAVINNNVQVFALTGDNEAGGGDTAIQTGNAYAGSSILNIANTNVIGSNWSNLIFTIYGDWSGNLTFGQPDLWLGVSASSPDQPIMPGSPVTYTFTVFNHGDTSAPDVHLETLVTDQNLTFAGSDTSTQSGRDTTDRWSLGDIAAGETKEFTYTAHVRGDLSYDRVSSIPLVSRVFSSQRDADESDNQDIVTIQVGEKPDNSISTSPTFKAHIEISKTASRDLAQPGDTVDYAINLFNRGGQLYDSLLVDTLRDENGEIVQQQTWPLGEIKNWDELNITYSIAFDSSMATGTYTNSAQLVGFDSSRKARYQTQYESPVATHTLHLGTRPEGQVLGAQTSTVCHPYITEYLRFGANNNPEEVRKLQTFLNQQLDRHLTVSGVFDAATEQAVRDFQLIHREEILIPWGLERDSGFVYYTTQKAINEIMCDNTEKFPLSADQQQEIIAFRNHVQNTNPSLPSRPMKPERMIVAPDVPTVSRKSTPPPTPPITPPTPPTDLTPTKPAPPDTDTWGTFRSWLQSLSAWRLLHR